MEPAAAVAAATAAFRLLATTSAGPLFCFLMVSAVMGCTFATAVSASVDVVASSGVCPANKRPYVVAIVYASAAIASASVVIVRPILAACAASLKPRSHATEVVTSLS